MILTRLKELRASQKLTQKDVAEKVGIARVSYTNYELGKREPDYKTILKLADLYDVTTDYLLGKSDDATPSQATKPPTQRQAADMLLDKLKGTPFVLPDGSDLTDKGFEILSDFVINNADMLNKLFAANK